MKIPIMNPYTKNNFQLALKSTNNLLDFTSLMDLFNLSIERYKDKTAYTCNNNKLTFNDIDRLSRSFAAFLQSTLNISKGERIGLMCPNILSFPVAMWGIIRLGGVQVNINPSYTAKELKHQLNDAQVETIVILSTSTKVLADIQAQTSIKNIIIVSADDFLTNPKDSVSIDSRLLNTTSFIQALKQGDELELTQPTISHKDLVFLQYTGGTTGLSKGAMLTHKNVLANVLQYSELNHGRINYEEETVVTAIPMYHIFALTINTLCYFFFGAQNILITDPRNAELFVQAWQQNKVTFFTGVNTLFNSLLHLPTFHEVNFSSLKLTIGGGAPVQDVVANKWFALTGTKLSEGYGLSETSPVLTLNIKDKNPDIVGIGKPLPLTEISIRDDDGKAVAQGESGELCAKGPQVMLGYWQKPSATKEVMTDDGYFKTGDIAFLDGQGYYHIIDRKKDMILVSGFNVYPNEIESILAEMPSVLESACVGFSDENTGESVHAFIVLTSNNITAEDVLKHCRTKLCAYKIPKIINFVNELPKSSVGKLLRRELRE